LEVLDQLEALAVLTPAKELSVLFTQEAKGIPEPFWTLWITEKPPASARNRTPAFQPITIPTELSRLIL
jgi:hypothetical protein